MSISESWYAVKDHGTNYCNLYNLMEGEIKQQYGNETTDTLLLTIHWLFVLEPGMADDGSVSHSTALQWNRNDYIYSNCMLCLDGHKQ